MATRRSLTLLLAGITLAGVLFAVNDAVYSSVPPGEPVPGKVTSD